MADPVKIAALSEKAVGLFLGMILGTVVLGLGDALIEWANPIDGRLRPDGRTVATRQSPSLTSSLGPDGRVSTIAGDAR